MADEPDHGTHDATAERGPAPPNRWVPLTLLTVAALGILAALVSISVGENREEELTITGTGAVQELIAGIPQLEDRLGSSDAPVSLTLYTDLQAPLAGDFQEQVIDPLIEEEVRTGNLQLVFRNFSLGAKEVTLGGIGFEAAAQQDHGWQFAEMFFRNQDQAPERGVDEEFLNEVAGNTPRLDVAEWEEAVDSGDAEAAAEEDSAEAVELRLEGDGVSVAVTGPNGSELLPDTPSREELDAAIERVG